MRQAFERSVTIDAVDPTVVSLEAAAETHPFQAGPTGGEVAVPDIPVDALTHACGGSGSARVPPGPFGTAATIDRVAAGVLRCSEGGANRRAPTFSQDAGP